MKYRLPRKDKKKIPKGMYCYVFNGSTGLTKDGRTWYGTNTCTFYQHDNEDSLFGYCKLVKGEVMDQCKSCGVKY